MKFFFLMCSERSGSNLISKMFEAHPEVCSPSTSHVGDVFIPNIYAYSEFESKKLAQDIVDLLDSKNAIWQRSFTVDEIESQIQKHGREKIFEYIYRSEAKQRGVDAILVKENRIYEFSQFLVSYFSQASYLYMHRDPRGMAASWKYGYAMRGGVVRAAHVWLNDQRGFMRMASWLPKASWAKVSYENLVSAPEITLISACDQLGIQYNKSMLDYANSTDAKLNALNAKDWQNIDKPLIVENIDKYQELLSQDEIAYVEHVCSREMVALGYVPSQPSLSEVEFEALTKRVLLAEPDKTHRYQMETTQAERERRDRHFSKSREVFSRPFVFEKNQSQ